MQKVTQQIIGSQMDLHDDSPLDMRRETFAEGELQMTGSTASLGYVSAPFGFYKKNIRNGGGDFTQVGSDVGKLDRTPHRGWESYNTPMAVTSKTAEEELGGYPQPGKRVK